MPSSPIRAPDLAELDTLAVCAETGSFAAAAERLGISRPAVAKRIGNLEALARQPLLDRGGRGVRLTDAGARVLAGARRILDERDVMVGLLGEIRDGRPSPISGLRQLLGDSSNGARSAHLPEARLAEIERMLAFVMRESATGVAISERETAVIYEVNEAFCRFVGRPREELIGKPATETGTWHDVADRPALIEQLRREGSFEDVLVRVRRPDGTMRAGNVSATMVVFGGLPVAISTVDDITEERRARLERDGAAIGMRMFAGLAARARTGAPLSLDDVVGVLGDLQRSGEFASAVLWDTNAGTATHVLGAEPWPDLSALLAGSEPLAGRSVRLMTRAAEPHEQVALAVSLPAFGHAVVLVSSRIMPPSAQALVADMLESLALLVEATAADQRSASSSGTSGS